MQKSISSLTTRVFLRIFPHYPVNYQNSNYHENWHTQFNQLLMTSNVKKKYDIHILQLNIKNLRL